MFGFLSHEARHPLPMGSPCRGSAPGRMQLEGVETETSTDTSATESFMPQGGTTPDVHRGSRDRDAHGRLGDGAPSYDGLHVCQWEWR